jgi:hypothetical protein
VSSEELFKVGLFLHTIFARYKSVRFNQSSSYDVYGCRVVQHITVAVMSIDVMHVLNLNVWGDLMCYCGRDGDTEKNRLIDYYRCFICKYFHYCTQTFYSLVQV